MFERLTRHAEASMRGLRQKLHVVSASTEVEGRTARQTTVHFKTHYQCAFGEQLKLVGDKEELGNWDVSSAPSLTWSSGDAWEKDVQIKVADETKFKLVLMSHGGIVWEPVSDRVLPLVKEDRTPAVAVDLDWGTEGYRIAAERADQHSDASQSSAAEEFDLLWNPSHTAFSPPGTPTVPADQARTRKSSCDVTLEPEWGVLDLDDNSPNGPGLASETLSRQGSASASARLTPETEEPDHTEDSWPEMSKSLLPQLSATSVTPELEIPQQPAGKSQERGLVKKRKKNKGKRSHRLQLTPTPQPFGLQSMMQNAQSFTVAGVSSAILSICGAHGQDVMFGSITIAAGSSVLQHLHKNRGFNFDMKESVLPIVQGIGQTVLNVAGALQKFHQKLQKPVKSAWASRLSKEEFEQEMAAYVNQLVLEATDFAQTFSLHIDVAESSSAEEAATPTTVSNIVAAKGVHLAKKTTV